MTGTPHANHPAKDMKTKHPTRSTLVVVGGSLAVVGFWVTSCVLVPLAHYAWTMSAKPVETTFEELTTYGLPDRNTHLRLIDVAVSSEIPSDVIDELLAGSDGELSGTARLKAKFNAGLAEAKLRKVLESDAEILVVPAAKPMHPAIGRIKIPPTPDAVIAAYREVRTQSTLTGRFDLNEAFKLDPMSLANFRSDDVDNFDGEPAFVYSPMRLVMGRRSAIQWILGGSLIAIMGLIAAGGGSPSVLCLFVFPAQSLLSLTGYPLRYRRANHGIRFLYIVGGSVALGVGTYRAFAWGNFGELDVSMPALVQGYLLAMVGLAAMAGALFNVVAQRFDLCSARDSGVPSGERRLTYDQACGMDPMAFDNDPRYFDPELFPIEEKDAAELGDTVYLDELADNGFSEPAAYRGVVRVMVEADAVDEARRLVETGEKAACDAQDPLFKITEAEFGLWTALGAGDLVSATIEQDEVRCVLRLTSVLGDGVPVMTLSSECGLAAEMRLGTHGIYYRSPSDQAAEMLSEHLENTLRLAQARKTRVVAITTAELADLYQFCGRSLADVQHQYGESLLRVEDASFGRFVFPPQPLDSDSTLLPSPSSEAETVIEDRADKVPFEEPTEAISLVALDALAGCDALDAAVADG